MKARTPTSTLNPPFTTAVTVPAITALSAKAFSKRRPILRPLHVDAREFVVSVLAASLDRNRQFVARLDGFASLHKFGQRNDSFDLVADIDENGLGSYRYDGAFQAFLARFGLVGMRLLVLGKYVAERFVRCWRIGTGNTVLIQGTWVGHETVFLIVA